MVGNVFSRSFRSSARPERRFHAEALGHACHPGFVSEGPASLGTYPERFQFLAGFRTIHPRHPIAREVHRPVTDPGG